MLQQSSKTQLLEMSKYDRIAIYLFRELTSGIAINALPDEILFDLDAVRTAMSKAVADDVIDKAVKNVADIKYTYDARRELPEEIEQNGPVTWLQNGKGLYKFRRTKRKNLIYFPEYLSKEPTLEPIADQGHERREKCGATHRTGDEVQGVELPKPVGVGRRQDTNAQHDGAKHAEPARAEAIRQPSHDNTADGQSDQASRVDQRDVTPLPAELLLQRYEKYRQAVDQQAHRQGEHHRRRNQHHPAIGLLCRLARHPATGSRSVRPQAA